MPSVSGVLPQVESDLMEEMSKGGTKATLMAKYGMQLSQLLKEAGGQLGDIPPNPDHEFNIVQAKLYCLNTL